MGLRAYHIFQEGMRRTAMALNLCCVGPPWRGQDLHTSVVVVPLLRGVESGSYGTWYRVASVLWLSYSLWWPLPQWRPSTAFCAARRRPRDYNGQQVPTRPQ